MKTRDLKHELDQIMTSTAATQAYVENNIGSQLNELPTELQEPEPLFVIDFEEIKAKLIEQARETIEHMLRMVIPEHYLNNAFMQHQIEVDSQSLGSVYYQRHLLEKVEEAGIQSISLGNLSARMIEVINMTAENNTKHSKQITDLLTTYRKNYIDIMLDIQQRENSEKTAFAELSSGPSTPQLEDKKIFVGSKEVIQSLKKKKLAAAQEKNKTE